MRRIAGALGIQPSALYWHFDSKQALLAAVADRIVDDGLRAIPADAGVHAVAHGLRDALLRHRDGADIVIGTQALALGAGDAHRRLRDALRRDGDDPREGPAQTGATTLLHFTLGHATIVQQRLQAARLGVVTADVASEARELAAQFDAGVRAILRGLTGAGKESIRQQRTTNDGYRA
ncbi:hypothetical protein AOA12_12735 [Microbacterium sp. No. 7]|nr:hypothetical protein AOA12_12735 [Microbacterium sp. No. 7]